MSKHYKKIIIVLVSLFGCFSIALWGWLFVNLSKKVVNLQTQNQTLTLTVEELEAQNRIEFYRLSENLSIIDASIDPENKRWVKIKHARKLITEEMKRRNRNDLTIKELTEISTAVIEFSEENNVQASLLLAVLTVESAFKVKAVSKAGARGLMQVMPETASEIAADIGKRNFNLFKVRDNIQFGSYYLWKMINLFGDHDLGISAYNCGPVCVERVRSGEYSKYPNETIDYLKKVNEWKLKYINLGVD